MTPCERCGKKIKISSGRFRVLELHKLPRSSFEKRLWMLTYICMGCSKDLMKFLKMDKKYA